MNKYMVFICTVAYALLFSATVMGQSTVTQNRYVNYDEYFREIGKWLEPWKHDFAHKTLKEIRAGAALLRDDQAPLKDLKLPQGKAKIWSDEEIFSKRRQSVFILGKLFFSNSNHTGPVDYDLMGTAFAISEDGACVTNYHALKNIIRQDEPEAKKDSIYFIITADKKVYMIDEILAFSQNNDLAVFKVNTQGARLIPIPFGKAANIGAPVYCISHPFAHFYYFSKGIVSRNLTINTLVLGMQYDNNGKPPIRMEITADYAVGSSGGPVLDQSRNLIGVVVSTSPIYATGKDEEGKSIEIIQMMVKDTSPVTALTDLLRK